MTTDVKEALEMIDKRLAAVEDAIKAMNTPTSDSPDPEPAPEPAPEEETQAPDPESVQ